MSEKPDPDSDGKSLSADSEPGATETLEDRVTRISSTFLTENPDFLGLARLWDEIAAAAVLVPESVQRDGSSTVGELSIPGSRIRAHFDVKGGFYRVGVDTTLTDGGRYRIRTLNLAFREHAGLASRGGAVVQYHPDTSKSASSELRDESERLLGWSVGTREGRLQATPLTARLGPDGAAWIIGPSPTRPPIEVVYGVDGRAEQALVETLRPLIR